MPPKLVFGDLASKARAAQRVKEELAFEDSVKAAAVGLRSMEELPTEAAPMSAFPWALRTRFTLNVLHAAIRRIELDRATRNEPQEKSGN